MIVYEEVPNYVEPRDFYVSSTGKWHANDCRFSASAIDVVTLTVDQYSRGYWEHAPSCCRMNIKRIDIRVWGDDD